MEEGTLKFAIVEISSWYDGTVKTEVKHEYFTLENAESEWLNFTASKEGKKKAFSCSWTLREVIS